MAQAHPKQMKKRNENIFYSKIPCQVAYGQPYLIEWRTISSGKVVTAGEWFQHIKKKKAQTW